ncbi:hypothetical protein WJX72_000503 [[Myrmecia] bisecta]|uniref:UDP-N-acetylmuramoyl-L-alanyl-D-glutamate synthetase n=1 Tax=[Myrmecia] bisecta TaxID=41462 RepID=A0AAW1R4P3_9CHLO
MYSHRHHRHALPALDLDGQNVIIVDTLVLSPGVPLTQPAVEAALECGVPAVSELGFAFAALPVALPLAAVTGTNGKSTVTTFSAQLLRACGLTTWAGGNLGTPLSELALACRHGAHFDAAVVEVSSYQLQLPGSFQPNVGVVLNVTPDHLERHLSMLHYAAAKCNCFAHMTPDDLAIIQEDDEVIAQLLADCGGHPERAWLGRLPGCTLQGSQAHLQLPGWDDALELDLSGLTVPGRHNLMNAATAALLAVALPVGVTRERLQAALPALQPPPHRMQVLGQLDGITWIDDSKATNLEAAIAGISGLEGPAVVLLGGQAKAQVDGSLGFARLAPHLHRYRAVMVFGTSGPAIAQELDACGVRCIQTTNLAAAVAAARGLAQSGDTILLSPACASFDEFRNFEHRGQCFAQLLQQWQDAAQ